MKILLSEESSPMENMVGQPATVIRLPDENGHQWRLRDQLGKTTVLLFYPQNETFVCNRQLCSMRDHWKQYLATGAEIVAISTSISKDNKAFADKYELPFRLLTDENKKVTKVYIQNQFLPLTWTRGVIIIDASGIVRYRKILLRAFRPSDQKILKVIEDLQSESVHARRNRSIDSQQFDRFSAN